MGTLVEHARIPWIKTEASYYCVIEPVFDSAGQSREKDLFFFFFFPASDIYRIYFLKPFKKFFRNVLLFPYFHEPR